MVHFVGRQPGMHVAALLDVLKITKQSLTRVLRQLIAEGYVCQEPGVTDRRQRCLYLSTSGEALWMALRGPEVERFARAFRAAGRQASDGFEAVLTDLLNVKEREQILDRVKR